MLAAFMYIAIPKKKEHKMMLTTAYVEPVIKSMTMHAAYVLKVFVSNGNLQIYNWTFKANLHFSLMRNLKIYQTLYGW